MKKYEKENLGTMVVFLLPSLKLKKRKKGLALEDKLHQFLLKKFNGYTAASGNIFGYWKNRGKEFYGEHIEYKVSLLQPSKLSVLESFLAKFATEMGEKTIYISAGEMSWLLYPKGSAKREA